MTRPWPGVVVAVLALFLTGCSAPTVIVFSGSEPPLGTIPVITSPDQVNLPIYAYWPNPDQTVAIMLQGESLINRCVQDAGGTPQTLWTINDPSTGASHDATQADLISFVTTSHRADATRGNLWGFFDPSSADQYGYGVPPGADGYLVVTMGDPGTGLSSCFDRVSSVAPGGSAAWPLYLFSLPDHGPQWPGDDSRFAAAVQSWSDCMKDKGYAYANPDDAMSDAIQPSTDQATQKAIAVADVACKVSTNLVGVGVAVQTAYQQEYIDSHREELATFQQQISDYLAGRVTVPSAAPSPSGAPS